MRRVRKIGLFISVVVLSLWMASGIGVKAAGGSSSISVSSSKVNVGDTVKVTLRVKADTYASFRMNLSYSGKVLEYAGSDKNGDCNGGGGVLSILSEVNEGSTYAITCTFKAKSSGEASISASTVEAISMETAEAIPISGAGTRITVNSQTAENNGNQNSTDNSGDSGSQNSTDSSNNSGSQNSTDNSNNSGSQNSTDNSNNNGSQNSTDNSNNNGNQNSTDSSDNSENQESTEDSSSTETLSKDNSLKILSISNGTLSPEFRYSTTKYSASVGADVTNVTVNAQTSHSKATVESIVGNNGLQPGENVIKVTVKAEDGSIAVYTINVTRGSGETKPEEEQEETKPEEEQTEQEETKPEEEQTEREETKPEEEQTEQEETKPEEEQEENIENNTQEATGIVIAGIPYEVSAELPQDSMPEEFVKTITDYEGKEIEVYAIPYKELKVFYLNPVESDVENAGKFFIYDAAMKQFFPYIYATIGNNGIVVLPMSLSGAVPQGYQEVKFHMGEFEISGCQNLSQEEDANEFYLIYGVDKQGTAGWYQYDAADMSLQRFQENTSVVLEEESGETKEALEIYANRYQELEQENKVLKAKAQKTKNVFIFIVLIAVITIVNLLLFGKKKNKKL